MKRFITLFAFTTVFVALGLSASPVGTTASAAPNNKNTVFVTCDNGETLNVAVPHPESSVSIPAFHLVDDNSIFTILAGTVLDPATGETINTFGNLEGLEKSKDLITCSFTSPQDGLFITVTGFITPQ